jgi:hypothetical protein
MRTMPSLRDGIFYLANLKQQFTILVLNICFLSQSKFYSIQYLGNEASHLKALHHPTLIPLKCPFPNSPQVAACGKVHRRWTQQSRSCDPCAPTWWESQHHCTSPQQARGRNWRLCKLLPHPNCAQQFQGQCLGWELCHPCLLSSLSNQHCPNPWHVNRGPLQGIKSWLGPTEHKPSRTQLAQSSIAESPASLFHKTLRVSLSFLSDSRVH